LKSRPFEPHSTHVRTKSRTCVRWSGQARDGQLSAARAPTVEDARRRRKTAPPLTLELLQETHTGPLGGVGTPEGPGSRRTSSARSGNRPPAPWGVQRARKEQRIHPLHADPVLSCENGSSRTRVVSLGQLVSDLRGEATVWGSRSPDATNLKRPNALPIGPSSGPLSPKVLVLRSLEAGRREDRGELRFSRRQVGLPQARSDCRVVAAQRPRDRNLDGLVGADRAA
jgi:hypothetical protein